MRETKSDELQKGVFHIDDLNISSQTVISEFYEKGWIIKTLATQDDFSYMILEKNNEMIYVAFNAVYDNVGDIGNDTKVDYVMLYNSPTLFQLNNQQNVSIDEIVDQYGTPNEVYYDAEKTIISYYANNGQNKIIFTANVDHELTEVRILLGQTFHGFETAWNTI